MSMFVKAIHNALESQTHNQQPELVQALTIRYIEFQKIQPQTKLFMQRYSRLSCLQITHCDLRTLDNFPNLHTLAELRLSHNKLQGSLENIIKFMGLEYLDLSHNIIRDVAKLLPLKRIKGLSLYVSHNPLQNKEGWKNSLLALNLKIEKEPKKHPSQPEQPATVLSLKKEEQPPKFTSLCESIRDRIDRYGFSRDLLHKEIRRTKIEFRDLKIEDTSNRQPPAVPNSRRNRPTNPDPLLFCNILSQPPKIEHAIKFEDEAFNSESSLKDEVVYLRENGQQWSVHSFQLAEQQDLQQKDEQQNESESRSVESYEIEEDNEQVDCLEDSGGFVLPEPEQQ